MSDMRLSCRDATNHSSKGSEALETHQLGWLRHDKLKHIGHYFFHSTFDRRLKNIGGSYRVSIGRRRLICALQLVVVVVQKSGEGLVSPSAFEL